MLCFTLSEYNMRKVTAIMIAVYYKETELESTDECRSTIRLPKRSNSLVPISGHPLQRLSVPW